jgi:predicted nucleotidyltransferase
VIQLHNIKKQFKKLEAFFSNYKKKHSIKLAYMFGSRAAGIAGPISDYDIAVLYSRAPSAAERYRLTHELSMLLMTDRVDLVILNHAPVELGYGVIASGILVYEENVAVRVEFEANTLSRYGDFLPILRHQRQEILENRYHETGIQRYRAALGKTQRLLEEIGTL